MAAGPDAAPRFENGAVGLEDEHLMVGMIADHEETSVADLDHFVTVEDRVVTALAGRHPVFVGAVAETAVAEERVLGGIADGGAERLEPGGGGGGGETGEEVAAGGDHGGFSNY